MRICVTGFCPKVEQQDCLVATNNIKAYKFIKFVVS